MLIIPDGWEQIKDGNSRKGDKCAVGTARGIRMSRVIRRHNGVDKKIPGKWELVKPENIGHPVKIFLAVIRRVSGIQR
jgi:hypothetical protein